MLYHANAESQGSLGYSKLVLNEDGREDNLYMDRPLVEILAELYGPEVVTDGRVRLKCTVVDNEDNGYKIPQLVYVFGN